MYSIVIMVKTYKKMSASIISLALILLMAGAMGGCATNKHPGEVVIERTMLVTAYCPCKKCCSWKRTWYGKPVFASGSLKGKRKKVGVTASGVKARPGTIAADPSVAFGTKMYVPGYGHGVVQDRGGAITGDHIDIYFKNHKDALQWGKKTLPVKVWVPAHQVATR